MRVDNGRRKKEQEPDRRDVMVKVTKYFFSETDLQVVQQDLAYDPLYRIRQERVLDEDDSPGSRFRQKIS
jgi:hypothetical protein